jgi:hypothetical protein
MTAIIQVPSTYPIKLPQGEWINLASFRRVEIIDDKPVICIIWDNNDDSIYQGEQAQAILEALEVAHTRAAGAIAQTPTEEEKEFATATIISMIALALLSEAIEENGGSNADQLVKTFTCKARDFYANRSEEEVENFMDKFFR